MRAMDGCNPVKMQSRGNTFHHEGGDITATESFNQRMTRILQHVYNRNKELAYDMMVMVNHLERTNYIIQDGIVYNSFDNHKEG